MLTYNPFGLAVELNMSNDVAYNILTYQANIPYLYGCHNFYPQEGTALPYDFFENAVVVSRKKAFEPPHLSLLKRNDRTLGYQ